MSSSATENRTVQWLMVGALGILAAVVWTAVVDPFGNQLGAVAWPARTIAAIAAWAVVAAILVWVDRRLPVLPEALTLRIGLHIPLSVVLSFLAAWLFVAGLALLGAPLEAVTKDQTTGAFTQVWEPVWPLVASGWLVYWTIAGLLTASDLRDQMRARVARTAELERLLAQSRIETLRTQLNPHFLFNALNAISAHVEGAPRTARWMLEQLGDLLRLSLDHADEQEITLQQELAFIDRYLKLQKIRFDNRLDVIVDVEPPALRALVPTFILQPLLENSIRHGIARRSTAGLIEIQAWQEQGALHLSVRDDGPGLPGNWDPEKGLGVGLKNTRERLRRLYGDAQTFEIAGIEGSGVRVDLTLPYRENTG